MMQREPRDNVDEVKHFETTAMHLYIFNQVLHNHVHFLCISSA